MRVGFWFYFSSNSFSFTNRVILCRSRKLLSTPLFEEYQVGVGVGGDWHDVSHSQGGGAGGWLSCLNLTVARLSVSPQPIFGGESPTALLTPELAYPKVRRKLPLVGGGRST